MGEKNRAPKDSSQREPTFEELCSDGSGGRPTFLALLWRRCVRPWFLRPVLKLAMRSSTSTAHSMLLIRTFFAEFGVVHANQDHLAPLLRDAEMPHDAAMMKSHSLVAQFRGRLMIAPLVGVPGIGRFVDLRTAWLDGALEKGIKGGAQQVVVIAAGFDTRAYRYARPGVAFFEIDLPHASAAKRRLVDKALPDAAAHPRPTFIAADLSVTALGDALAGTGFDPKQRTVFLAEGLLYYLPPQAVRTLLGSVASLASPGSRLCFDYLRLGVMRGEEFNPGYETLATAVANRGEPFRSAIDDSWPGALDAIARPLGFRCTLSRDARAMSDHFYKGAVPWKRWPASVSSFFSFADFEKV